MRMTFQCRLTKAAVSFTASFVRFAALFAVCAVFFVRFSVLREILEKDLSQKELEAELTARHDELIPLFLLPEDIFS